jgi:hypothetical protein
MIFIIAIKRLYSIIREKKVEVTASLADLNFSIGEYLLLPVERYFSFPSFLRGCGRIAGKRSKSKT